jgi:hypothetical protein
MKYIFIYNLLIFLLFLKILLLFCLQNLNFGEKQSIEILQFFIY